MKKTLSLLMSLVMLLSITAGIDFTASAAGNSISNATSISFDTQYNGYITNSNDKDVYKFTLSNSGRINIVLKANIHVTNFYIYDSDGATISEYKYRYWNDNTQQMTLDENLDLTKGTYYFAVVRSDGTGNYNFKISYNSAKESFSETKISNDNSIATANYVSLSNTYYGQIAANDDKDLYRFTLNSSGKIRIVLKANIYVTNYYLYNSDGTVVSEYKYRYWDGNTQQMILNETLDLVKGTYYLAVVRSDGTGNYNFKISYNSAQESFTETIGDTNNSLSTADIISLGTTYRGQLAANDDKDLYKFVLNTDGKIYISLKASIYVSNYYIYDSNGTTVSEYKYRYWDGNTQQMILNETLDLSKGTYYFAVVRSDGTGNYSFNICSHSYKKTVTKATLSKNGKIEYECKYCGEKSKTTIINYPKTIKLSKNTFTYNGKVQKPSVIVKDSAGKTLKLNTDYTVSYSNSSSKNVGKYTVTVKFKGNYSGTKTIGYKINPKPTEFVPSNKGGFKAISKGFTLKWNKQASQTTGYQIQYATKRDFSNAATITIANPNTTSKTIKGRAGNTRYYVRVRTYKKIGSGTFYSSWNSGTKSVVTLR